MVSLVLHGSYYKGVVKPRETMKGKCHIFLSSEDKARMEAQKGK